MDLGAIRDALEAWVGEVTELPVQWRERPPKWGGDRVVLHITGFRGVGNDEVTEDFDEAAELGQEITPHQRGQRVGTLEVRCETQSQADGRDALYFVQRVRDRLSLPEADEALHQAGAAFGPVLMEPRDITQTRDQRRVSVAQTDLALNAATNTAGQPYGTIETVGLTVEGRDPDGAARHSVTRDIEVG